MSITVVTNKGSLHACINLGRLGAKSPRRLNFLQWCLIYICGSWVWNLCHVTLLGGTILTGHQHFWKICAPLVYCITKTAISVTLWWVGLVAWVGGKKCKQSCDGKTPLKLNSCTAEELGKLLKWIPGKRSVDVWLGLEQLRIGIIEGLFWCKGWISGFHNRICLMITLLVKTLYEGGNELLSI
jgi:hypothetical protein